MPGAGQAGGGPTRLLVIDDDPTSAGVGELLAGASDLEILPCSAPVQALPETLRTRPTVVLLELALKTVDSLVLLRFLRGHPETRELPVLVWTAWEEPSRRAAAFTAGATDYFLKSVPSVELLARVRYHARAYQAFRALAALSASTRRRVLVVDDDRINRVVLTDMLESLDCEVATAENGRQAVEAVLSGPFDLVLMDCEMPVMNGFDAACLLRTQHRRTVPIVALTGHESSRVGERCTQAGIDEVLTKPLSEETLRRLLAKWPGSETEQPL
ncbi:MAG: response regulator [Armatimonadetes bacterium]|nr:response regulator [Armatimonadota bacterium]